MNSEQQSSSYSPFNYNHGPYLQDSVHWAKLPSHE